MKKRVTQCNNVTHSCVFNSFSTTMEHYGAEEQDMSGTGYTNSTRIDEPKEKKMVLRETRQQ